MTQLARMTVVVILLTSVTVSLTADDVDRTIEEQMRNFHIPGISVAVVRNGRIVKAKGYGLADVELNVPMTKDHVLEVGSITKQFTAAAIMMLVEDGFVGLDEAISEYIPSLPAAWSRITVRHLLTHTSGIVGNVTRVPVPGRGDNTRIDNRFYQTALAFHPGEGWAYSNPGYHLLGVIIANVSGESCADFVDERILKPLGMLQGRVAVPNGIVANRAAGYAWNQGRLENRAFLATAGSVGDVGIESTVGDLAKWDAALYTNKLVAQSSLDQMWTAVTLNDGARPPFDYGFGWFLDTYRGHRVIHHPGVSPGFSSTITRFVDDKLTVIVLANSSGQVLDQFARRIAALYLSPLRLPKEGILDPDATRSETLHQGLLGMISGKPDLNLFTPAMQRFLMADNELSQWLASFGNLSSFVYAGSEQAGRDRMLLYRIILGDSAFTFSFTLTDQGKIAHAFFW
jgi:CubicO group peptidase (beta-lactamase class C family)